MSGDVIRPHRGLCSKKGQRLDQLEYGQTVELRAHDRSQFFIQPSLSYVDHLLVLHGALVNAGVDSVVNVRAPNLVLVQHATLIAEFESLHFDHFLFHQIIQIAIQPLSYRIVCPLINFLIINEQMNFCCLSKGCRRVLTDQDDICDHSSHKIVTSKQIRDAFERDYLSIRNQLFNEAFLSRVRSLEQAVSQKIHHFTQSMCAQLTAFSDFTLKTCQQLKGTLDALSSRCWSEVSLSDFLKAMQDPTLENILKVVRFNHNYTEKELKEGLNDPRNINSAISIDFAEKIKIETPKQSKQIDITTAFMKAQFNKIREHFSTEICVWVNNLKKSFKIQDSVPSRSLNLQVTLTSNPLRYQIQRVALEQAITKLIVTTSQNLMQIFELESFKLIRTHRFDDAINDFTIFAEAGLVAAQVNQQTSVINLLTGRLIRKHSTNLDTSSSAFLRYIDDRLALCTGTAIQLYAVYQQSEGQRIEYLNLNQYWDKISALDYVIINKMGVRSKFIIVGTIGGMVMLYDMQFKELFQQQFHQAQITQFRFLSSEIHGKVLLTVSDDMRVNSYIFEGQTLKCSKVFVLPSVALDILTFPGYFYITTINENQFELYQIKGDMVSKLSVDIQENSPQICAENEFQVHEFQPENQDCFMHLCNRIVLIRNNQFYLTRVLN